MEPDFDILDESDYIFSRGFRDSLRLNVNHLIMRGLTGYLTHPKIPLEDAQVKVADIGTGTGIWLNELAAGLPSTTRLIGFDISEKQWPHVTFWPQNVSFVKHDCLKPFPAEYHAQFDVVNVRFWLTLLNDTNAATALSIWASLLKPGGYLQWYEPLAPLAHVHCAASNVAHPATDQLVEMFKKPTPSSSFNWLMDLSSTLTSQNLIVEACERYEWRDTYRASWAQSNVVGLEDQAAVLKRKDEGKAKEMLELAQKAAKEAAQGVSLEAPYICAIGRKT